MFLFVSAAAALAIIAAILRHKTLKHKRDAVANLPGPYCWPLVGAVQLCFILDPSNILEVGHQIVQRYGKLIRIWAFHRLVVMSSDVQLNEQLLASQEHLVKHRNYRMLRCWLGEGLLLSDGGGRWLLRRKIIAPTFHFKLLEQFVAVFDRQTETFVKRLAEKADGRTAFDVYPFVCAAALDIIAETAMGTKIYAQTDHSSPYALAVQSMIKLMSWRFMKIHLNNELIFSLLHPRLKLRQQRCTRIMHEFTMKIIKERRQVLIADSRQTHQQQQEGASVPSLDDANEDAAEDLLVIPKKRMALLDVLLQSTLTDDDIREEVDTFMFAGHDTSSAALAFALHLIARHADVQQRLRQEVTTVLGDDKARPITLRQLSDLKYTECVIKETLRLYPPVPIIGREIEQDFPYAHSKYGNGIIPAGTEFLIPLYGMMRDPERFENPHCFQPERHASAADQVVVPGGGVGGIGFSSLPFSAGPRNCIGQKFAMLELKTFVAKMVREYELLPRGADVQPEVNIVMRSTTGFQLGLRRR